MEKIISVILLAALLMLTSSCGGGIAADTDSGSVAEASSSVLETEPAIKYDFGGSDYRILCRTDKDYEFNMEEQTGDIVDDAVYERNQTVESDYNVNIVTVPVDGNWSNKQNFIDTIAASVLSGTGEYELIAGYNAYITGIITQGYLLDINTAGIDFDKPWWYSGYNDNIEIAGKRYFCLGDASLTMWENMEVVYFNKGLIEDFGMLSPYEQIADDTWTFEVMSEYCKLFSNDINNDAIMDEKDNWGIIFFNQRDLATYFEIPYCITGSDGYPVLSLYNERFVDFYDTVYSFIWQKNYGKQFEPDVDQKIFSENRAMFFQGTLKYAELFRDNENDFGIVPFPKYDEVQDRYYTTVTDSLSVFCVPSNVSDPEYSGVILDALCRESSEIIIPKYYDKALKVKYSRDSESEEMLDLIRDSIWFDFGYVYSISLNYYGSFLDILKNNTPDVSSAYAAKESSYKEALNKLILYFKENIDD